MSKPLISVVSPVYMSAGIVDELVKRISAAVEKITPDYEIILVEDGSRDDSWNKIAEQPAKNPKVIGVKLSRNFGQHYAMSAGLAQSKGDWVMLIDCDLQDPPEAIEAMYKKALEGYQVVLAARKEVKESFLKRTFSKVFYAVFNYFTDTDMESTSSSMKLIARQVVDNFNSLQERHRFFGGMLNWLGYKTAFIEIEHSARHSGKSSYNFKRRMNMATEAIISFSIKPLRLAIRLGFLLMFLSGSYLLGLVIRNLIYKTTIIGWSSLIATIIFSTGIMVILMGIIGLYVGKIFEEVKRRPNYIVEKITDSNNK